MTFTLAKVRNTTHFHSRLYYVHPARVNVTLVYCVVGWIKMKIGVEVGLGPGDFVLDGDSAFPCHPKKGQPPIFGP